MTQLEERLKLAILRCVMSQVDLAKMAKVPQPVISYFLAGRRGMTLKSAGRLSLALGLRLEAINRGVT